MNSTCFVTGGSGFVGGRLIERLVAQGWHVRALVRNDAAARHLQNLGAQPVRGELTDHGILVAALTGCDVVIHVAALFKLWGTREEFEEANVRGTAGLLKAAQAAGVRRFVQIGAAAVVMGDMVDVHLATETLPRQERPWAPYSASKARSEALVVGANRPGVFETIVIRPPMIWGAGMPTLDAMIASVKAGEFRFVNHGTAVMSTVHVDNVCHAAELAIKNGRGGEAYFISDGEDRSFRDAAGAWLESQKAPLPKGSFPLAMAWFMATLMEGFWRAFSRKGEPPITRQLLRLIGKDFTLDTSKAQRELRYQPEVSWARGVEAMAARARG
jgi:nucleoside-diphosphate-sugar epimerase